MSILAIDPGNEQSAFVVLSDEPGSNAILEHGKEANEALIDRMISWRCGHVSWPLAIEMVASYGMPVGATVFETCVWIGRFIERWGAHRSTKVYRSKVKQHICKSVKASDSTIRMALLDFYGGKKIAIGTSKAPGPMFGVVADEIQALALALTFRDGRV